MGTSIEAANVALIFGLAVVIIATIRWEAGIIASLIAATLLNYFCTEPIHSLRVTSGDDLLTIFLLMSLGLGVSAITAYRAQRNVIHRHHLASQEQKLSLQHQLQVNTPVAAIWERTQLALFHDLDLVDIRINHNPQLALPRIARHSETTSSEYAHIVIPQSGAILPFRDPRLTENLVFTPREGVGPLSLQRDHLFLFAHQLEAVLTGTL